MVWSRNFLDNKILFALLLSNIFVLIFFWFIVVWRFKISADFIPLHYTLYFGFDRFGPKFDLFLFPTLSSLIFTINTVVTYKVLKKNKLWQGIMLGLTLLLQLILFSSLILSILKTI
jgi:hypothetical protein